MVFSKLYPIIPCSWSNDFCTTWNDFLFGLSCSLFCSFIVALLMYIFTDIKPQKEFSKQIKPILKQKLQYIHIVYNDVFQHFDPMFPNKKYSDNELIELLSNKKWGDHTKDSNLTYSDIVIELLLEIRRTSAELLSYNRYLNSNQILIIENIVNATYNGINTAKKCKTNSEMVNLAIISGCNIIKAINDSYKIKAYSESLILSYKKLLELEDSFKYDK